MAWRCKDDVTVAVRIAGVDTRPRKERGNRLLERSRGRTRGKRKGGSAATGHPF
jgi:hypothetical protein